MNKTSNYIKYGLNVLEDTTRKWFGEEKIRCIRYTVTWECNSKCDSCWIWKEKVNKKEIMTLEELEKFACSPILKNVRRIIISGGEPFLLEDLPERLHISQKYSFLTLPNILSCVNLKLQG